MKILIYPIYKPYYNIYVKVNYYYFYMSLNSKNYSGRIFFDLLEC